MKIVLLSIILVLLLSMSLGRGSSDTSIDNIGFISSGKGRENNALENKEKRHIFCSEWVNTSSIKINLRFWELCALSCISILSHISSPCHRNPIFSYQWTYFNWITIWVWYLNLRCKSYEFTIKSEFWFLKF